MANASVTDDTENIHAKNALTPATTTAASTTTATNNNKSDFNCTRLQLPV